MTQTSTAPKLTPARRAGLQTLADGTGYPHGNVVNWLQANGLVDYVDGEAAYVRRLTDAGRAALSA